MIRIGQLKLKTGHTKAELEKKLANVLGIAAEEIQYYEIRKTVA